MDERPARRGEQPASPVGREPGEKVHFRLARQASTIVAVLALSFLIELTLVGHLRHDRDQGKLAAQFRNELAQATGFALAPVGPFDEANKPLAAGTPVAVLEIPKLRLREIVVEGTASGTLMSGPGHRRDTPLPGQAGTSVIAGRRATYGRPFRSLDQLLAGDQVTVTTGQGKHSFTVRGVRRAGDLLPPALARGQGRLTLVTTAGPAFAPTDVLRVDAELTSETQPRPAQLPSQAVPAAEAMLVGDKSALLGILGWSVLLMAAGLAMVWVRYRAGPWPAWAIGVPVLTALSLATFEEIAALLPNLL